MPCSSTNTFKPQKSTLTHGKQKNQPVLAPFRPGGTIIPFQPAVVSTLLLPNRLSCIFSSRAHSPLQIRQLWLREAAWQGEKHRALAHMGCHQLPIYYPGDPGQPS